MAVAEASDTVYSTKSRGEETLAGAMFRGITKTSGFAGCRKERCR